MLEKAWPLAIVRRRGWSQRPQTEHVMKTALILASTMLACCGAAQASPDGPLAPARAGQLQCYQPDTARRTCVALSGYSWDAKGAVTNRAEVMISRDPLVSFISNYAVFMRGEAICGPFRAEDLQNADVRVNGQPATADITAKVRSQLVAAMAPQFGHELCTTYLPGKSGLQAQVTLDGVAHPEMGAQVIWVKPDEGYKVAP